MAKQPRIMLLDIIAPIFITSQTVKLQTVKGGMSGRHFSP
jgi:hypothetical protein